jgi:hypothetical protein
MDEFNERRGFDMRLRGLPTGPSGEHDQERPQALAASRDDVRRDLVNEGYTALQASADHGVNVFEVALDQGTDFIEAHGGKCIWSGGLWRGSV